jgi:hypothetical protein
MRKAMLFLAAFACAGSLWAADPIIGTWKLNIAKSRSRSGGDLTVKERTDVYREIEGRQIEWTRTETRADGSSSSSRLIWPQQGGIVLLLLPGKEPVTKTPDGESIVETFIEPGKWYVTRLRDAKQRSVYQKIVSKDGKTLNVSVKGYDEQGKPYESLTVYDKQ